MSLHVCRSCGTVYAPAALCPHCGYDSFRYDWEEEDIPEDDYTGPIKGEAGPELIDLPAGAAVVASMKPKAAPKTADDK